MELDVVPVNYTPFIFVRHYNLSIIMRGELSSYAQCWCLTYDNNYRKNVAVFLLTRRVDYARRFIDNFTKIGEVYICFHKPVHELIYASWITPPEWEIHTHDSLIYSNKSAAQEAADTTCNSAC